MLVAFLTAFYMFRVVFLAFFGAAPAPRTAGTATRGRTSRRRTPHDRAGRSMALPLWILALLSMAVGI